MNFVYVPLYDAVKNTLPIPTEGFQNTVSQYQNHLQQLSEEQKICQAALHLKQVVYVVWLQATMYEGFSLAFTKSLKEEKLKAEWIHI